MRKTIVYIAFILFGIHISSSQPWMTSLPIAQDLALVQNKMVLMVWEETTKYPYPVIVNDDKGNKILINNLFTNEYISPLIWQYFVPVIVSENQYEDMYNEIKDSRSQSYKDKFNDDSIKIMDVNGNILNVSAVFEEFLNVSKLIENYYIDTSRINTELRNYRTEKNFYSAYYLAEKYLDFTIYVNKKKRPELAKLADIYLKEAKEFVKSEKLEDQKKLTQRTELLDIQKHLILNNPRKVVRQLNRIDENEIDEVNVSFMAFLYYTAYKILGKEEEAEVWKSKVSLVNLKKAQLIYNINS